MSCLTFQVFQPSSDPKPHETSRQTPNARSEIKQLDPASIRSDWRCSALFCTAGAHLIKAGPLGSELRRLSQASQAQKDYLTSASFSLSVAALCAVHVGGCPVAPSVLLLKQQRVRLGLWLQASGMRKSKSHSAMVLPVLPVPPPTPHSFPGTSLVQVTLLLASTRILVEDCFFGGCHVSSLEVCTCSKDSETLTAVTFRPCQGRCCRTLSHIPGQEAAAIQS